MTPITAYHSSVETTLEPRRFLHVGTLEQATMRGGRNLHEVVIRPGIRLPRLRDTGEWNVRTLMRHASRARIAVYLNRYEGIPPEQFEAARAVCDVDRIADSEFRRRVPAAADSWIVLDVDAITSIRRI